MTQASTAQTTSGNSPEPGAPTGQFLPGETGGGGLPPILRRRLAPLDARFDVNSWLATAVVVAIAAILRFVGLSSPKGKIFDEVYYATDAHNLLTRGFEWDEKNNTAAYVVHPPLGKWMIALGEWMWGYNELGWRFSAAVVGSLSVLLLVRIARRMFRSTVLGCAAGLLLALDGFHLVLSRTALLDIFLLFFVLAAFGAVVLDRDARRRRWLRAMEAGLDPTQPGRFSLTAVPWWRLLAAVLLGCAISVKWSALYFVPAFGILVLVWEAGLRRSVGVRRPWRDALLAELPWLVLAGVVVVLTYIATWSGWLLTDGGYYRHWRQSQGKDELPVIGALQNLWEYHRAAYGFHTTLDTSHKYQSWPWQWLLLGRPVAFYWSSEGACGAASCAAEILLLGTPILWWSFLPALVALVWLGIARRDWRAGTILLGAAAGLLPWFWYALDGRTMFVFYVAPALPFLVLAVVYVLGAIITPGRPAGEAPVRQSATTTPAPEVTDPAGATVAAEAAEDPAAEKAADRRLLGSIIAGGYVLVVAACFAYFHPIFVGKLIPYAEWSARMWLDGRWI
ncbi:dolichyl-phosphate-mannose--protein mannosyltransferase [Micromonospora echinofusca]|uniref:Polyprenol-phosphate-mannose--protein mannosyltransferase n=1 Tax=Micromonospora echinofusca TaxID=47858 RepID=A0ABS3VN95_MICEH|nr:phospholipid carrier-dependent glycosyltransferase [Micromonospora echinofusca]MBO4205994.1 phospholipid carrier-dependent glycosyltransferase [Micromonospora echinofusca]